MGSLNVDLESSCCYELSDGKNVLMHERKGEMVDLLYLWCVCMIRNLIVKLDY